MIDLEKGSFWISVASTAFNPLFWNMFARKQYKNQWFSKIIGDRYIACYILAFIIFSLGLVRDYLLVYTNIRYQVAVSEQPKLDSLNNPLVSLVAILLIALGNVFVLSSMYRLGVTGTYLGDYFGILMKSKVTGFPFNVISNPMYNGSSMIFLGMALRQSSVAGIVLSLWVFVVYQIALLYEGPFTDSIYAKKSRNKKS